MKPAAYGDIEKVQSIVRFASEIRGWIEERLYTGRTQWFGWVPPIEQGGEGDGGRTSVR